MPKFLLWPRVKIARGPERPQVARIFCIATIQRLRGAKRHTLMRVVHRYSFITGAKGFARKYSGLGQRTGRSASDSLLGFLVLPHNK